MTSINFSVSPYQEGDGTWWVVVYRHQGESEEKIAEFQVWDSMPSRELAEAVCGEIAGAIRAAVEITLGDIQSETEDMMPEKAFPVDMTDYDRVAATGPEEALRRG